MAIWQFDIHFLPTASVLGGGRELPLTISRSTFDCVTWWPETVTPEEIRRKLDQIMPRGESWNRSVETWGSEDGNRIDLIFNESRIEDIYARIDVRNINYEFLTKIVSFSEDMNCAILTDGNYILPPSVSKILSMIEKSASFRFVVNPTRFFERLKELEKNSPL